MIKIFHLPSCSTCQRIIKELEIQQDVTFQDIKTTPISEADLDKMKASVGSYEAVFSKRAMKYKSMDLKNKNLKELDYKRLILEEYTFLKRPVIFVDNQVFIGNAKSVVAAAKMAIHGA
ncbi:hypothetical protein DNU06_12260 [Putridiphycobacter roseus]|uniref:Arsenate reductase n=2 Tax=Putridiphycobacter roseus TaxID=2219161 RepID=A0A2W1N135_9FLAO|nr:hypothetical protein DNU06_12260 [Putridiphycobacter roseus]